MGAEDYNRFLREEKSRVFESFLTSWKTKDQIQLLYEEGHSPSQLADLFDHEVGFEKICEQRSTFYGTKKSKEFFVFPKISKSVFAKRLASVVPYTKELHSVHLAKPQWWKIRFSHLNKSEDEVKEIAKSQLLRWQKNTCNKRKEHDSYNPIYTTKYWESLSEDPQNSLEKYKREISPRCVEFWLKKGFDLNEAKKRIGDVCRAGTHTALKSLNGNYVSKLEKRIYELLNDATVKQQLFLGKYSYDFYKKETKKIVEINGTYWHADPRVHLSLEEQLVHGTVQQIRDKDEQKISYAKSKGWDVLIVWELDYCKSPNDVIESIKGFLEKDE
jgi:very-short-patch-repair endonuclease